jgi:uncharacterized protein YbjT (DUF2867 family)
MYVVTGATGNTGRVVAERLLAAGKPVRVIGRDAAKLQPLVARGAEPVQGSLDDPKTVAKAFESATAVYFMVPPDFVSEDPLGQQRKLGETIVRGLRDSEVTHTVFLSSVGASNYEGAGPVSGLGRIEELLTASDGIHALLLRPGFFMENLYSMIPTIKQGFLATPLKHDLPMAWIASADIGYVIADELLGLSFNGMSTRELHGQRDLTMDEVTSIVGKAIGNPNLRYIEASYADAEAAMIQSGLRPALAAAYVEMYRALNERRMKPLESRTDRSTTPTSIEAWVKGFAPAVR